jgi:hypothetical protein
MTFDEVIRNSRSIPNLIWTKSYIFFFPQKSIKIFPVGPILSGRSEKGKQTNGKITTHRQTHL